MVLGAPLVTAAIFMSPHMQFGAEAGMQLSPVPAALHQEPGCGSLGTYLLRSCMHLVDKAVLYEDVGSERSTQDHLWGSVIVSWSN